MCWLRLNDGDPDCRSGQEKCCGVVLRWQVQQKDVVAALCTRATALPKKDLEVFDFALTEEEKTALSGHTGPGSGICCDGY